MRPTKVPDMNGNNRTNQTMTPRQEETHPAVAAPTRTSAIPTMPTDELFSSPASMADTLGVRTQDVLCGKGKAFYSHSGNQRFRAVVDAHLQNYLKQQTKAARTKIVSSVTDIVLGSGGRFLRWSHDAGVDGSWEVLSNDESRAKVSQTIRDAARENRGNRKRNNGPTRKQATVRHHRPHSSPSNVPIEGKTDRTIQTEETTSNAVWSSVMPRPTSAPCILSSSFKEFVDQPTVTVAMTHDAFPSGPNIMTAGGSQGAAGHAFVPVNSRHAAKTTERDMQGRKPGLYSFQPTLSFHSMSPPSFSSQTPPPPPPPSSSSSAPSLLLAPSVNQAATLPSNQYVGHATVTNDDHAPAGGNLAFQNVETARNSGMVVSEGPGQMSTADDAWMDSLEASIGMGLHYEL